MRSKCQYQPTEDGEGSENEVTADELVNGQDERIQEGHAQRRGSADEFSRKVKRLDKNCEMHNREQRPGISDPRKKLDDGRLRLPALAA
jgi:hypothetical protein